MAEKGGWAGRVLWSSHGLGAANRARAASRAGAGILHMASGLAQVATRTEHNRTAKLGNAPACPFCRGSRGPPGRQPPTAGSAPSRLPRLREWRSPLSGSHGCAGTPAGGNERGYGRWWLVHARRACSSQAHATHAVCWRMPVKWRMQSAGAHGARRPPHRQLFDVPKVVLAGHVSHYAVHLSGNLLELLLGIPAVQEVDGAEVESFRTGSRNGGGEEGQRPVQGSHPGAGGAPGARSGWPGSCSGAAPSSPGPSGGPSAYRRASKPSSSGPSRPPPLLLPLRALPPPPPLRARFLGGSSASCSSSAWQSNSVRRTGGRRWRPTPSAAMGQSPRKGVRGQRGGER